MNGDQFGGIVRTVVASLVAYGAGKGWFGAETASDIVAAASAVAIAGWSFFTNKPGTVIAPK